jgi:hypothetical protein
VVVTNNVLSRSQRRAQFDPISCVYWIIPAYRTRPAFGPLCP